MNDENNNGLDDARPNSASDERKEKAAAEAYVRIRSGQHWRDWMFVAEGLGVGRRWAQHKAGTDDVQSPRYKKAFKEWMRDRPWAQDLDSPTRAHLFWCLEWRNDIEQWRETLAANERAKLNHPTALKRRFEAAHRIIEPDLKTAKRETALEAHIRENESLHAQVQKLERQIEAGDGSLFDLRRDQIDDIVNVIVGRISLGRLEKLTNAMVAKLRELKKVDKTKQAKAG
jgi:hypothetical protein